MLKNSNLKFSELALDKLLLGAGAFVLILVGLCGWMVWEYGDDYLNIVRMRNYSLPGYVWFLFNNWDGRVLSIAGVMLCVFLKIGVAKVAVAFYLFVLLHAVWVILNILSVWTPLKKPNLQSLLLAFAAFLIGIWPWYKDVLFWLTGGYYSIFLWQGVLVFWWFSKSYFSKTVIQVRGADWAEALFVLILSLNSQNIMLPFGLVMFLAAAKLWLHADKKKAYILAAKYLMPVFIGALIVSIAPGNWIRLQAERATFQSGSHFSLGALISMLVRLVVYAKWPLVSGLLLGVSANGLREKMTARTAVWMLVAGWVLAFVSLVPFMVSPALARLRVYFPAMVFILFCSLPIGAFIGSWIQARFQIGRLVTSISLTTLFAFGILFFYRQYALMKPFAKLVEVRKDYLESKRGTKEIVHYKRLELPAGFHLVRWADVKRYGNWDQTADVYELGGYVEDP